jgi:hypothetical protein
MHKKTMLLKLARASFYARQFLTPPAKIAKTINALGSYKPGIAVAAGYARTTT